jgi:hypothetical protein
MKALASLLMSFGLLAAIAGAQPHKVPRRWHETFLRSTTRAAWTTKRSLPARHFPLGTAIGFHTHPGDESRFVVKGSIILKTRGQHDRKSWPAKAFSTFAEPCTAWGQDRMAQLCYPRGSSTKACRSRHRYLKAATLARELPDPQEQHRPLTRLGTAGFTPVGQASPVPATREPVERKRSPHRPPRRRV